MLHLIHEAQICKLHDHIRARIQKSLSILYGVSSFISGYKFFNEASITSHLPRQSTNIQDENILI